MRINSIVRTVAMVWAAAIFPTLTSVASAQTLMTEATIKKPNITSHTLLLEGLPAKEFQPKGSPLRKQLISQAVPDAETPHLAHKNNLEIDTVSSLSSNSRALTAPLSPRLLKAAAEVTAKSIAETVADHPTRPLPSLTEIQQLQNNLSNLNISDPVQPRRRVYPGITISNPTGYGADRGQTFAGIGAQSRTRFSGGSNVGTIFGGGKRDGVAGIGFGIGNAQESVGLQVSYTAASFGGSRPPLSGGLNAKLHKQFGDGWAAAIGGEGIINFGRLPADNDEIAFNDFEGTYYGVATYTVQLREDFTDPFSRLTLTGGAGSGRFRTVDQIANGEFAVGVFGSAALQVLPWANVITEWTGQDLAAGVSIAPFPNIPVVVTPAVRDIVGAGDGDPRFVLGLGVSVSDLFSSLGL